MDSIERAKHYSHCCLFGRYVRINFWVFNLRPSDKQLWLDLCVLLVWIRSTHLVHNFCMYISVIFSSHQNYNFVFRFQYFICYNNPESHPFISEKEKNYLSRELGELKRREDLPSTPWRAMLTCPAVIALIFAQIGIYLLLINWNF